MTTEKLKQIIALFGGLLSAAFLFLKSIGIIVPWYTEETIGTFVNAASAAIPLVLVVYGVWKNTYVVTKKAREQEKHLQEKGLK